jgi:hypothetical protein
LKSRIFGIIFLFLWSFSVLYPNPTKFFTTLSRLQDPPVNYLVEELKPLLRDSYGKTPKEIEKMVKEEVPYSYDWEVYNLPLYFPTVEEVMKNGTGDCKSRFLITASIFEYYQIDYSMLLSPVHVWISYEGRPETKSEKQEIVVQEVTEEGIKVKIPEKIDWEDSRKTFYKAFFRAMPISKRIALCLGFFISLFFIFPPKKLYFNLEKG